MYSRTGCDLPIFYFEAIQLKVNKNDSYTIISSSTINTFGYIYKNEFNSLNPSINRILRDDDSCNNDQFKLIGNFSANMTYIVIVTTHDPNVTGAFSIIVSGVEKVSLERLGEYEYPAHYKRFLFLLNRYFIYCRIDVLININNE
jgi:hypothetical protein